MRRKCVRGFSLIELLVVIGIIGILAAMAIANYLNGLQKARQKRTMADIRSIANAWEARAVDVRAYNAAGQAVTYTMPTTPLTQGQLASILSPTYMRVLPSIDGWSYPMEFAVDAALGGPASEHYAIRSAAGDRAFQTTYVAGPTDDFDCDIVFADGNFVVYPRVR